MVPVVWIEGHLSMTSDLQIFLAHWGKILTETMKYLEIQYFMTLQARGLESWGSWTSNFKNPSTNPKIDIKLCFKSLLHFFKNMALKFPHYLGVCHGHNSVRDMYTVHHCACMTWSVKLHVAYISSSTTICNLLFVVTPVVCLANFSTVLIQTTNGVESISFITNKNGGQGNVNSLTFCFQFHFFLESFQISLNWPR